MNNIPNDCFQIIRNYSGYTIEQLYEDSGISEATIKRYFYDQNKKRYKKSTIIAFLLFTNCPYNVSIHMLEVCKCNLNISNKIDMLYNSILENRWFYDYKDNIKYIKEKTKKL